MRRVELFVPDLGESLNAIMFREKGWAIYRGVKRRMAKAMLTSHIGRIAPFERPVRLTFHPKLGPKRRKFDVTNHIVAVKIIEDVLVECGTLRGDSTEYVHAISIERPELARNGIEGILVQIAEVAADAIPRQPALELVEELF